MSVDARLDSYLEEAAHHEIPPARLSLDVVRLLISAGRTEQIWPWVHRLAIGASTDFATWHAAAGLMKRLRAEGVGIPGVPTKVAVLGTYTTTQFADLLVVAGLERGLSIEAYSGPFAQISQEVLDPSSGFNRFRPDFVVLAAHHEALSIPEYAEDPATEVERAVSGFTSLWDQIRDRNGATVVQHNLALPPHPPTGHLGARDHHTRQAILRKVNEGLAEAAGDTVAVVDCERMSAEMGKSRWFDDRYWYVSKQAVSPAALPTLSRHTTAVLGALAGLTRKCLVLDLDNTLWGGIVGEDGLSGIRLGDGPVGEAFVAFQEHILGLKDQGVILAVCSKNDDAVAREPFLHHPDMRIRLDDISAFIANWSPKPDNLRAIASTLGIGVDSMVFVDDQPAERELVRQVLPEVDVVVLPDDPAGYRQALGSYLGFERMAITDEDRRRTEQYKARAVIREMEESASSIDDFLLSLDMTSDMRPFDDFHLPRLVQLIGKTNQFNLTTRRHSAETVEAMIIDPSTIHFFLKLSDRFADHGLVAALIALPSDDAYEIDTWLMSCRVLSRRVEDHMFHHLVVAARERGASRLVGSYLPTPKNGLVKDLYRRLGFGLVSEQDGATRWEIDLDSIQTPNQQWMRQMEPADGSA